MSPEMKYCNPVNLTVKQHSLLLSPRQCEQGEPNHEVSVRQIILLFGRCLSLHAH